MHANKAKLNQRRTRLWQVRLYRVVGDDNRYTTKEKTNRLVGREWSYDG